MLLRFCSAFGREVAMGLQPITYNGTTVRLERQEETDNRFLRVPNWLALVHVWDFPEEHWDEGKVRAVFSYIGSIMEIDLECLTGNDRSSLCFVIELVMPRVPYRIGIHPRSGRGAVVHLNAMEIWPRVKQFDGMGAWIPFFGPPAAPQGGAGPASSRSRRHFLGQLHHLPHLRQPKPTPSTLLPSLVPLSSALGS